MRLKRQLAACLLFKRLTLKLVYALLVYALKDKYNHALKEAVGSAACRLIKIIFIIIKCPHRAPAALAA